MPMKQIQRLSDLVPDSRNANRGTPRGNAMIEQSLRNCGAGRSILIDKHGRVIAGNKTVENAGLAGVEELLVVDSDGTKLVAVRRTDLDLEVDPLARELALLDNRTSEVGLEWDAEIIAAFEREGMSLSDMFTDAELEALANGAEECSAVAEAPDEFPSVDADLCTDYQCPKCGYEWSGKPK